MPLSKDKKAEYFKKMTVMLNTYSKVFVVVMDNVGSQQLNITRKQMRGKAEILMGKNTLMRKVLKEYLDGHPNHFHASLDAKIAGNVGFVFTNYDLPKVRDMILANRVPAPARIGAIAPIDVNVPPGPTGCDPGQTSFFQVLQIPTKIVKGQIEITSVIGLIKKGDKVGSSESALLQKLNIRPFSYGMVIDSIIDQGSIFGVDVLDISEGEVLSKFVAALTKVAALSLQIGYPTQASIPHSIGAAFKTLVAVAVNLEQYSFKEAEPYKQFLANPSAFASAAPATAVSTAPAAATTTLSTAGAAAAPAPVVAPKPKVEEVDALDGGMSMFGPATGGGDY